MTTGVLIKREAVVSVSEKEVDRSKGKEGERRRFEDAEHLSFEDRGKGHVSGRHVASQAGKGKSEFSPRGSRRSTVLLALDTLLFKPQIHGKFLQ